jgi:hypothetical protein
MGDSSKGLRQRPTDQKKFAKIKLQQEFAPR